VRLSAKPASAPTASRESWRAEGETTQPLRVEPVGRARRAKPACQRAGDSSHPQRGWRKRLRVELSPPARRGATGFEDREDHRAPFASGADTVSGRAKSRKRVERRRGCWLTKDATVRWGGPCGATSRGEDGGSRCSGAAGVRAVGRTGACRSAFDQAHLTGARTLWRFLLGEFDALSLA